MKLLEKLRVKIFADGADLQAILELYGKPYIQGFTTNPTLMRRAGVSDYEAFARSVLAAVPDRPISFEVIADDFEDMERQALKISDWGENVYVKIPVTNTACVSSEPLIRKLAGLGIKINVTAMTTLEQVRTVSLALRNGPPAYVSLLAGRVADTGRDPVPVMTSAVEFLRSYPNIELLWASPREVLNILQADAVGCHIITVTGDLLKKLELLGKDLDQISLETVKMFFEDAEKASFRI